MSCSIIGQQEAGIKDTLQVVDPFIVPWINNSCGELPPKSCKDDHFQASPLSRDKSSPTKGAIWNPLTWRISFKGIIAIWQYCTKNETTSILKWYDVYQWGWLMIARIAPYRPFPG